MAVNWFTDTLLPVSRTPTIDLTSTKPETEGMTGQEWTTWLGQQKTAKDKLKAQIRALNTLAASLSGAENWINRWLIGNEIAGLQNRLSRMSSDYKSAKMHYEWAKSEEERYAKGEREPNPNYLLHGEAYVELQEQAAGRKLTEEEKDAIRYLPARLPPESSEYWAEKMEEARGEEFTLGKEEALPIPDWMREYITGTTTPAKRSREQIKAEARGKAPSPAGTTYGYNVAPLGAQADLTPEQLKALSGYLAWQKAGAPGRYTGAYASQLSEDWADWWEHYVNISKGLFPSTYKPGLSWRPTSQR